MKSRIIALGSTSRHKLNALEDVLSHCGVPAEVIGYSVVSEFPEQPVGLEQGFAGARYRAFEALQQHGQNSDDEIYFVGIESFVSVTLGEHAVCLDMAAIVIIDQDGDVLAQATSPAFPFPMDAYTAAKEAGFENHTVGSMVAKMYGGDGTDPHSSLSRGRITRMQTLMAGLSVAINQLPIF